MVNNAVIKLLKTFSNKDMKEFREFLESPFFNKRKSILKLFDILKNAYPEFDEEKISRENIFSKLFPGKKYNDSTFRVTVHYLYELIEKYFAYIGFEKHNFEYAFLLNKELLERKLYKLSGKIMSAYYQQVRKADMEAEDYYLYKYRFESKKMDNIAKTNSGMIEKYLSNIDHESLFNDLTNFYLLKSMTMYLNVLSIPINYNKNIKYDAFNKMFANINIDEYENMPVIKMNYYTIKMLTDSDNESYFFKIKDILRVNRNEIHTDDLMRAFVNMTNYCLKKIMENNTKFEKERFEIYKEELIVKTYLNSDGHMSPIFFRNVVVSGLNRGEHKWVRNFILQYIPELHKDFRENYYFYCMAQYEFAVKNYESSMELNSKIVYDELYLKLNSKILQMEIFYEMKIEESLISALENFRHFLVNNKLIPKERKPLFVNFHKYLNRLIQFKNKNDKLELNHMKSQLINENKISNKKWILEKISELI
ncbi:MAG: hypothetical protein M3R36_18650 [Bacteroidota bacterium]|nr:hypothetical protein [Bacteroidota bacterium]